MSVGVVVLGSTGSIGINTLKVIERFPKQFHIVGLAAKNNIDLLAAQVKRHKPASVAVFDARKVSEWNRDQPRPCWAGLEGLCRLAGLRGADVVVTAISGAVGMLPTHEAIRHKKRIALANKETLVSAGEVMMKAARKAGVIILPVDSEHSAIFQCLQGSSMKTVKRLMVTGSGGPFRRRKSLAGVTVKEALKHPTWRMGKKITVDSATLMNKGLEVIEAHHLFGLPTRQIEVVIHPQSVIHSLVEYVDGSILAQLGVTDMRLPIQYALSFPDRWPAPLPSLNLASLKELSFEPPDRSRFPCLELAYEAVRQGGTMPAVLNASNEEAVRAFLDGRLPFTEIPRAIERAMKGHRTTSRPSLREILEADRWTREEVKGRIGD